MPSYKAGEIIKVTIRSWPKTVTVEIAGRVSHARWNNGGEVFDREGPDPDLCKGAMECLGSFSNEYEFQLTYAEMAFHSHGWLPKDGVVKD
jgi:hypothetical protein